MSGLVSCRSFWPTFAGRLAEDFDAFETRLIACLDLEELQRSEPITDKAKVDLLLLLLPPASAAAHHLQQAPRAPQTLQQALDHLRARFSSPSSRDLTKAALHNALHLRRFRDAEHASELVESALDDVDRLGLALKLSDAAMRESLLRCFCDFPVCSKLLADSSSYAEARASALKWESRVVDRVTQSAASKDAETRAKSRLSAVHGAESLKSPDIDKQTRRRSALSSSFPSPPDSAPTSPLPRTPPAKAPPKRPLSQISLQEIPTALPRVDLQEDDAEGGTETLLEPSPQPDKTEMSSRSPTPTRPAEGGFSINQEEVQSSSASPSSPIDYAAMQRPLPPPPSESRDLPSLPADRSTHPPAPGLPLRRPATAPASQASRDSFRTASPFPSPAPLPDSRETSKPGSPAPTSPATPSIDQDTTTASSVHTASTGTSQTGSSKLPPDHPYIRRLAPVPFPPERVTPVYRLSRSEVPEDEFSDQGDSSPSEENGEYPPPGLFYEIPHGYKDANRPKASSTHAPSKLRRKSLSTRNGENYTAPLPPIHSTSHVFSKLLGNASSKVSSRGRAWSLNDS